MTPTQHLAGHMLGQPLADYVTEKRDTGQPWSTIAADLSLDTNGAISVSRESLRQWYGQAWA